MALGGPVDPKKIRSLMSSDPEAAARLVSENLDMFDATKDADILQWSEGYLNNKSNNRRDISLEDEYYNYKVNNPLDLDKSEISSNRLGTDKWVNWNDKNMPAGKRAKALATLRAQNPDTFSKDPYKFNSYDPLADLTDISDNINPVVSSVKGSPPNLGKLGTLPNPSSPEYDYLKSLEDDMNKMGLDNEADYKESQASIGDLFKRKNNLNVASGLLGSMNGLQNTDYEALKLGTASLNNKYQRMPISALEQQASNLRGQVSNTGRELLREGVRPSEVGSILGQMQGRTSQAESNLRFNFYDKNLSLDRARSGEFQNILDQNQQARIVAKEKSRDDNNQLFRNQIDNLQNVISGRDSLLTNKFEYLRGAKGDYNKNKNQLIRDKFGITSLKEQNRLAKELTDARMKEMAVYLAELQKNK